MNATSDEKKQRLKPVPNPRNGPIQFSHPAEKAFAQVLDFYEIEWEYEPTTFPLRWDDEGRVIMAFSPDFYLVEDDLYIELTTMKQRLVTAKNRKLKLLHQLYPDVKCKLMYRQDIANMGIKYGLFGEQDPSLDATDPDKSSSTGSESEESTGEK